MKVYLVQVLEKASFFEDDIEFEIVKSFDYEVEAIKYLAEISAGQHNVTVKKIVSVDLDAAPFIQIKQLHLALVDWKLVFKEKA